MHDKMHNSPLILTLTQKQKSDLVYRRFHTYRTGYFYRASNYYI